MNLVCRTTVSRFGNSRAVVIPKSISKFQLKSKIDLYETSNGILIKPVGEWSAEKQNAIISDILAFSGSDKDNEPIPDNFAATYCSDDNTDHLDFSGLEEN
ncbi:MAG: AbrB/MazE/SpoVT family DNA-binding domain-containing protein [Oscillospiraceae bacterium]|nr:AbrB/MazE/SpoVT family DNA-binding domain-containing protein [Oscillospiraceae bacterium]